MNKLSLVTAFAAMKLAAGELRSGRTLSLCGLTKGQWAAFTGNAMWQPTDRSAMMTALKSLINYTLDAAGLQPFQVSAEYVCAVIVLFVNPTNMKLACAFADGAHPTAAELAANGVDTSIPNADSAQLYAICQHLVDSDTRLLIASQWEKTANIPLAESIQIGTEAARHGA